MLFSSLPFLFYFLPCALGLYFLVPGRLKNAALLLCSLVFYAWGEPRFVLFMAAAIYRAMPPPGSWSGIPPAGGCC